MRNILTITNLLVLVLLLSFTGCSKAEKNAASTPVPELPVKNTVTLVDFGAQTCVPCKLMAPLLEELKVEYQGKAEVIFVDVWAEANKGKAQAFKVMAIPTQIFFDRQGQERYRHIGFFDKEAMAAKLDELLAQ